MSSAVIKFIITANYNYILQQLQLQQLQLQQLQLQQLGTTTIQIQFTITTIKQTTTYNYNRINKGKAVLGNVPNFFTFGDTRRTTCHEHVVHVTLFWGSRDTDWAVCTSRDTCHVLLTSWIVGHVAPGPAYRPLHAVTFLQYMVGGMSRRVKRRVIRPWENTFYS